MQSSYNYEQAYNIVKMDANDIYIGNLNTVDTDLILPNKGARGSDIEWNSEEILFISHSGKVTRPTYGVGNRVIPLTAKLKFMDAVYENNSWLQFLKHQTKGK